MLDAVLNDAERSAHAKRRSQGGFIWRVRACVPTTVRAWVAEIIPDRLALELAARLELRGVDWHRTKAFMMPNDDAGYIRVNLRGRERDGVVERKILIRFWSGSAGDC
jgi:hypothetical protein